MYIAFIGVCDPLYRRMDRENGWLLRPNIWTLSNKCMATGHSSVSWENPGAPCFLWIWNSRLRVLYWIDIRLSRGCSIMQGMSSFLRSTKVPKWCPKWCPKSTQQVTHSRRGTDQSVLSCRREKHSAACRQPASQSTVFNRVNYSAAPKVWNSP
jgi:hypothetical protein